MSESRSSPAPGARPDAARVEADMRDWVERAVIGLNLCPFAKAVQAKGLVHYAVSEADDEARLLLDLDAELQALAALAPQVRDTTLLIAPHGLADFLAFNDFLARAERRLRKLGLEGEIQIASFHPRYQFADTEPDDITNFTNRAPYPALHLLREASIERAVAGFPEARTIFERNMRTLRELGPAGWSALGITGCGKLGP